MYSLLLLSVFVGADEDPTDLLWRHVSRNLVYCDFEGMGFSCSLPEKQDLTVDLQASLLVESDLVRAGTPSIAQQWIDRGWHLVRSSNDPSSLTVTRFHNRVCGADYRSTMWPLALPDGDPSTAHAIDRWDTVQQGHYECFYQHSSNQAQVTGREQLPAGFLPVHILNTVHLGEPLLGQSPPVWDRAGPDSLVSRALATCVTFSPRTGLPAVVGQFSTSDPALFAPERRLWTAHCAFRRYGSFIFPGARLYVYHDRARRRLDVNLLVVERASAGDANLLSGDPGAIEVPHHALIVGPRQRPVQYSVAVPGQAALLDAPGLVRAVPCEATEAIAAGQVPLQGSRSRRRAWLPWLLGAAASLGILLFLQKRRPRTPVVSAAIALWASGCADRDVPVKPDRPLVVRADLGIVDAARDEVSHTFVIENSTAAPWHIDGVFTTCRCLEATISSADIAPGGDATLTLTLGVRSAATEYRYAAIVQCASWPSGSRVYELRAQVPRPLEIAPSILHFTPTSTAATLRARLTLSHSKDETDPIAVESSGVEVIWLGRSDERGYRIHNIEVVVAPDGSSGPRRYVQEFRSRGSVTSLVIEVEPLSPIGITPGALVLGEGETGSCTLVRRVGTAHPSLGRVPPWAEVKIEQAPSGPDGTFNLSFRRLAGPCGPAVADGMVEVVCGGAVDSVLLLRREAFDGG